jgi:hypothetical protein
MASNMTDEQVNEAIMEFMRRPYRGKKMQTPKIEESEVALRPCQDPPPGYADETPPYYDGKGKEPVTKEKLSAAEEASVAEKKAPVAAESAPAVTEEAPVPDDKYKKPANFKLDPSYFMRKRAAAKKTGPTEVCIQQSRTYPL